MKNLINVKLKQQGIDLVGYTDNIEHSHIKIENPIQIKLDPNNGFFAVDWMYLSENKSLSINKDDMFYFNKPSDRACAIYKEFWESLNESQRIQDMKNDSDIEELLTLFEASQNIKH